MLAPSHCILTWWTETSSVKICFIRARIPVRKSLISWHGQPAGPLPKTLVTRISVLSFHRTHTFQSRHRFYICICNHLPGTSQLNWEVVQLQLYNCALIKTLEVCIWSASLDMPRPQVVLQGLKLQFWWFHVSQKPKAGPGMDSPRRVNTNHSWEIFSSCQCAPRAQSLPSHAL